MPEPIRHDDRRDQTPAVDSIAHPRAHDLDPTGPVGAAYGREIRLGFVVDVLRQERGDPRRG